MNFGEYDVIIKIIIAVIFAVIAVITALWRVLNSLYTKPRDEQIKRLESRVAELSASYHVRQSAAQDEQALKPDRVEVVVDSVSSRESTSSHVKSTSKITEGPGQPLDSLDEFASFFKRSGLSLLQTDAAGNEFIGSKIKWKGSVISVDFDKNIDSFFVGIAGTNSTAVCIFKLSDRPALSMLKKDDILLLTGVIRVASETPVLDNCEIESVATNV